MDISDKKKASSAIHVTVIPSRHGKDIYTLRWLTYKATGRNTVNDYTVIRGMNNTFDLYQTIMETEESVKIKIRISIDTHNRSLSIRINAS